MDNPPPVEPPKVKKQRVKKPKPPHEFKIIKATPEAPIIVSFK
jgi:hypothetical protein